MQLQLATMLILAGKTTNYAGRAEHDLLAKRWRSVADRLQAKGRAAMARPDYETAACLFGRATRCHRAANWHRAMAGSYAVADITNTMPELPSPASF